MNKNKIKELSTTTALVKSILEKDERSRNSDSFLYYKVLSVLGERKNIDISHTPITVFLLKMAEWGFPPFESVRRARQKLQNKHPELEGCDAVREQRSENEEAFREYAKI